MSASQHDDLLVRVRKAESDPDVWAVDYRQSIDESWDTLPRRFFDLEAAESRAAHLEAEISGA